MKNLFRAVFIVFVSAILVSCGSKTDGIIVNLTPSENQQRLEEIGNEVLSKFKPEVQKDLIKAVDCFIDYSYELEIVDKYASGAAYQFASVIKSAVAEYNISSVSSLASPSSDLYEAGRVYGIYTYSESGWSREESTDKLEFRFTTDEGKSVVATVAASAGGSEIEIDGTTIVVPQQITGTVTINEKNECQLNVKTQCNFGSSVSAEISLEANGYLISSNIDVNNDSGSADALFSIDNEQIITASASFDGKNIADPDYIYDNYETVAGSATAVVNIMNDAQLKATCSNISNMVEEINDIWNRYDYPSYESARDQADIYNRYLVGGLTYIPAVNFVATLEIAPYFSYTGSIWNPETNTYENHDYYYTEPLIVFTSNGSKYSLEEYFNEENFAGLIDSFNNLWDIYEGYVNVN